MDRMEHLENELSEVDAEIDRYYEKVNRKNKIVFRIFSVAICILAIPFFVLFWFGMIAVLLAMTAAIPFLALYAGFTAQPEKIKRRENDGTSDK